MHMLLAKVMDRSMVSSLLPCIQLWGSQIETRETIQGKTNPMKKYIALLAIIVSAAFTLNAADAKSITVSGDGKCAKCALKQADKCQNVIIADENGKKVTYYLTGDVSKAFHSDNLCSGSKAVTATGTATVTNGKHELAVTKIEAKK